MSATDSGVAFVAVATESHASIARLMLASIRSARDIRKRLYVVGRARTSVFDNASEIEEIDVEAFMPSDELQSLVSRYTPAEVCFALKPYVLRHVLADANVETAHYVDGDLRFYASVDVLNREFGTGDILLTPHYLLPFPDDGRKPGVLTLLRGGVFNAGYVGVRRSRTGLAFLDWWAGRVSLYGRNEPRLGMAGDQRWLDLVPALFPSCRILRHVGANVGYWNLHERPLTVDEAGHIRAGTDELIFFHFSGFNLKFAGQLSKYQTRIEVASGSVLEKLLNDYARELETLSLYTKAGAAYAYKRWWHRDSWGIPTLRRHLRKHW
ncbi:hypothetical protein [Paraburkholderia bannensis]|uniref:hypothetical protein n=1 Tax=Paraburkholderia bannensis TaxID=765414 RepID=UPI002AB5F649|nr:hypothetical protein [Paraburkholderia bannensis]